MATDQAIVKAMEQYGGSFVKALAGAWNRADMRNRARIKHTFPDLWERYASMVEPSETVTSPKTLSDYAIIELMITYGNRFVRSLATAWLEADKANKQKLKDTWPDYWEEFSQFNYPSDHTPPPS